MLTTSLVVEEKDRCTIRRVIVPPCETILWLQSDGFWQHFIIIQTITQYLQDQVTITPFYFIPFIRKAFRRSCLSACFLNYLLKIPLQF